MLNLNILFGSTLELNKRENSILEPKTKIWTECVILFLLLGIWQFFFADICTDWAGFIVDEGFVHYGASRWLTGELPYRDFFFLWTPGSLLPSMLAQFFQVVNPIAVVRWISFLFFSAIPLSIFSLSSYFNFSRADKIFFCLLSLTWGFAHWNIPYASWFAIAISLIGYQLFISQRSFLLIGFVFGLSFWLKQNIGIFSLIALHIIQHLEKFTMKKRLELFLGFLICLSPGIFYFVFHSAGKQFASQVFLFPLVYKSAMFLAPNWQKVFSPVYLFFYLCFASSFFAWLFFACQRNKWKLDKKIIYYGFFSFCLALQCYPRMDFQHILFSFLPALPMLLYFRQQSSFFVKMIIGVSLTLAILGGAWRSYELAKEKLTTRTTYFNLFPTEENKIFLSEAQALKRYLSKSLAWHSGDSLLVLPHEETLYFLLGAKNVTPHNQILPRYVESFGDIPEQILPNYKASGGHYVVLGYAPVLKATSNELYSELIKHYRVKMQFPYYFSIWEPKN